MKGIIIGLKPLIFVAPLALLPMSIFALICIFYGIFSTLPVLFIGVAPGTAKKRKAKGSWTVSRSFSGSAPHLDTSFGVIPAYPAASSFSGT